MDRRKFIKNSAISGLAAAAGNGLSDRNNQSEKRPPEGKYMGDFSATKLKNIRAAFIGVGARGGSHLKFFGMLPNTEIVAVSDLYQDNTDKWVKISGEIGNGERHTTVKGYYGNEDKWKLMLEEVRPDVVFISTNWSNHAPMAIASMEAGAHAFVEVPMAISIKEMWDIVDTSERMQKHCMMMENVNYSRDELMFLNMCRSGVIGEILHGEAAYIHELRWQMNEVERGTGSWRTFHYAKRNGNLYPTHGLGPVAQYMNLARSEDTFDYLVSLSSPAMGRASYAKENFNSDHQWNNIQYSGGDMNTTIIKTKLGRTILVQWDETSPRPYTRHNLIQGTKGILAGFPTRVALEGGIPNHTENHHSWVQGEDLADIYEQYDHPLYKRLNDQTKNSGHGGMDGLMMYRIVECLQQGLPLDQNVYEGCFWSAVSPLSEQSVAENGRPQSFPDFTRGNWKSTNPLQIIH